ncbi:MAG: hypothetical protein Q8K60_03150 [Parachlamydiaceae bacterium]|nr:hypothetical protein [Parachlamydiaceae bacterium]
MFEIKNNTLLNTSSNLKKSITNFIGSLNRRSVVNITLISTASVVVFCLIIKKLFNNSIGDQDKNLINNQNINKKLSTPLSNNITVSVYHCNLLFSFDVPQNMNAKNFKKLCLEKILNMYNVPSDELEKVKLRYGNDILGYDVLENKAKLSDYPNMHFLICKEIILL